MTNHSETPIAGNGLLWLLNEYGRLNDKYDLLDFSATEDVNKSIQTATGMDGKAFVQSTQKHLLDRLEMVAMQISFTEPSKQEEALALLAFSCGQKTRVIMSAGDAYYDMQLTRLADRCERNACRYLQDNKPPIDSNLFHWISCHLYKCETHAANATALVDEIRRRTAA
ncbi:MAG: hypothetical protein AAF498_09535 [Pseudomonadota bacterium]